MKKHWQKITIGILLIALTALAGSHTILDAKHWTLQSNYNQTLQTLQTQTQLIAELRQKAVPHNFESLDELKQWVDAWEAENKPTVMSILAKTLKISKDGLYSQYWDCDDISEAMQRDALQDGYLISICLVSVRGVTLDHAGCLALADNDYWFIEPQTGEMTMMARRD